MQFRSTLRYHLVRLLHCSHKEADLLCMSGQVLVDGAIQKNSRAIIGRYEQIQVGQNLVREGAPLKYVLFYKPNLYECTANRQIPNHIYNLLPAHYQDLFPLGRLDLNSEGLLLLTNDGSTYHGLMGPDSGIEKEYLVHTRLPVDHQLENAFTQPFLLGKRYTRPARFQQTGTHSFQVILEEGINRHIRRICAKCHNQVQQLIRIRFGNHTLGELKPGETREVSGF